MMLTFIISFVDVNKETLEHVKFKNVFSLGDASSLPTSKTAAAVASQSGVLVNNMLHSMGKSSGTQLYDGYTSCPLITGKNKLILAEFSGYSGQPMETFPVDQGEFWHV
jgi:sulfide:quinone oxidoreductase